MKLNFVKKARKPLYQYGVLLPNGLTDNSIPNPSGDIMLINKGESYYWWKPLYGSKIISKNKPSESDLTSNEYIKSLYEIQEVINNLDMNSTSDMIIELIQNIEQKIANLPPQFRYNSKAGKLLNDRSKYLNAFLEKISQCNDIKELNII